MMYIADTSAYLHPAYNQDLLYQVFSPPDLFKVRPAQIAAYVQWQSKRVQGMEQAGTYVPLYVHGEYYRMTGHVHEHMEQFQKTHPKHELCRFLPSWRESNERVMASMKKWLIRPSSLSATRYFRIKDIVSRAAAEVVECRNNRADIAVMIDVLSHAHDQEVTILTRDHHFPRILNAAYGAADWQIHGIQITTVEKFLETAHKAPDTP